MFRPAFAKASAGRRAFTPELAEGSTRTEKELSKFFIPRLTPSSVPSDGDPNWNEVEVGDKGNEHKNLLTKILTARIKINTCRF
jgi:hypothetical protein